MRFDSRRAAPRIGGSGRHRSAGDVGATRRSGDQRDCLGAERFDERGDGARCLVQGVVCVVGVHDGGGPGVLPASDEPSVVAGGEPFSGRAPRRATACSRRSRGWCRRSGPRKWSRKIVVVHAGGFSCAAVGGSGVSGLGPGVGSSTTRWRVAGGGPWAVAAGGSALRAGLGGGPSRCPPPRAAPPPGPPGSIVPCVPASGCGCGPLDPAGSLPTGGCGDRFRSVRQAERTVRGQLGDIGGTAARCLILTDRDGHTIPMITPGTAGARREGRALVRRGPGRVLPTLARH